MHCPSFTPSSRSSATALAKNLTETAHDPYLLGIMTDNEVQCPVDLLDRYLALDAANPDLKPARKTSTTAKSILQRDRYEFIGFAFERYYRIVSKVIRKYDPNHLYLGSRINYQPGEFDNPCVWKALARYHDVVSVNYYGHWGPQAGVRPVGRVGRQADPPDGVVRQSRGRTRPGQHHTCRPGWSTRKPTVPPIISTSPC